MQSFANRLPPGYSHHRNEYQKRHDPRPGEPAKSQNGGIHRQGTGAAHHPRPRFIQKTAGIPTADFLIQVEAGESQPPGRFPALSAGVRYCP
jgi:hypothetical protein